MLLTERTLDLITDIATLAVMEEVYNLAAAYYDSIGQDTTAQRERNTAAQCSDIGYELDCTLNGLDPQEAWEEHLYSIYAM